MPTTRATRTAKKTSGAKAKPHKTSGTKAKPHKTSGAKAKPHEKLALKAKPTKAAPMTAKPAARQTHVAPGTKVLTRYPHAASRKSPNVIGPAPVDLFGARAQEYAQHFAPLVSFDLAEVDPSWHGTGFFVHWDLPGRVAWDLGTGRPEARAGELAALTQQRRDYGLPPPEPAVSSPSYFDLTTDADRCLSFGTFGGAPAWLQDDETPTAPDGNPMVFVAQLHADRLSGAVPDFVCFLFYSPRHQLLCQVTQAS